MQAAGTSGRRLLQSSNITVTLRITVSPLAQSAAEVEAAARAVYEAVTGNPSESLPEGASLDTVLQILNQDLVQGDAQRLLERVQEAIVQQNLTSLFNATLTNATAISGGVASTRPGPDRHAPQLTLPCRVVLLKPSVVHRQWHGVFKAGGLQMC